MPVMRVTAQYVLVLIVAFGCVRAADAYGPTGHRIVGEIAAANLCTGAEAEVARLLDGQSLGRAGQWPDWIRREPEWQKSRPWHFINVPDNGRLKEATGRSEGDVIWAVQHFSAELADRELGERRRAEALRFLAHFVADVHQPLHVGRATDRGGNQVSIRIGGASAGLRPPSNLHQFWDAQYLLRIDRQQQNVKLAEQIESISRLRPSAQQAGGGVFDWARESLALRPEVYSIGPERPARISPEYAANALHITRERLAAAGYRLARELNRMFCSESPPPVIEH